jgi:hypothetical protein
VYYLYDQSRARQHVLDVFEAVEKFNSWYSLHSDEGGVFDPPVKEQLLKGWTGIANPQRAA